MYPSAGSQHSVSVLVFDRWDGAAVGAGVAAEAVIAPAKNERKIAKCKMKESWKMTDDGQSTP